MDRHDSFDGSMSARRLQGNHAMDDFILVAQLVKDEALVLKKDRHVLGTVLSRSNLNRGTTEGFI